MGVKIKAGRRRDTRSLSLRRKAARQQLTAAGVVPTPALTTLDISRLGPLERYYHEQVLEAGYSELGGDAWPCEAGALSDMATVEMRDGARSAVFRLADGTICCAHVSGGWFEVHAAATSQAAIGAACLAFRELYPASYLSVVDDPRVAITFWTNGQFGPQSRLRRIEAQPWAPVRDNYTEAVKTELDSVMSWHDGPGRDGQLMLWQGPPGTGKTYALRALAQAWAPWAEFHYITDPDAFFVDQPSYMIDVLLSESYSVMEPESGDVYTETNPEGKWRVLILEDTGELLSANAKEKYGQGLSRLLNVVDGMIGQGLRVLALVTTNDELDDLNPATTRPGRCASQIVFGAFSDEEAQAWTGDPLATGGTLAELYARRGQSEAAEFVDEDALVASGAVTDRIFDVAKDHVPESGSYGDAWWSESTKTVFWNAADWSTEPECDAAEEAFLDIDGVDNFAYDFEVGRPSADDGADDWERIYPGPKAPEQDASSGAAVAAAVALAREPLLVAAAAAPALLREQTALREGSLAALTAAHEATVAGIRAVTEKFAPVEQTRVDPSMDRALGILEKIATRPPSDIHVTVPQGDPKFDVHVEAPAPAPAPDVHVTVMPPEAPQAPVVHVHVPPAEPQPAPIVNVEVQPAELVAAAEPARRVRIEYDDQGRKVYVSVPEQLEA